MNKLDEVLADDDGPVYDRALLSDLSDDDLSKFQELFEEAIKAIEKFGRAESKAEKTIARAGFVGSVLALREFVDDHCPDKAERTDFYVALFHHSTGHQVFESTGDCRRLFDIFDEAAHRSSNIKPPLFVEDILASARAYQVDPRNQGCRPANQSGEIQHGPLKWNCAWLRIQTHIYNRLGKPPLPYDSLADLFEKNGIVNPVLPDIVTEQEVLESASAFWADPVNEGRRPNDQDGPIQHGPLTGKGTWRQLHNAIAERRNGFEDAHYMSLAAFFDFHEFKKAGLVLDEIEEAAHLFIAEHKRPPGAHEGDIKHGKLAARGENWRSVYDSFLHGWRGLEDCGYKTMGAFFVARGLCGPEDVKKGVPKGTLRKEKLLVEDILASARAYQADPVNQGRRPSKESGSVKHGPLAGKTSWKGIDQAIKCKIRGFNELPYESLADLLNKHAIPKFLQAAQPAPNSNSTNSGTLTPAGP